MSDGTHPYRARPVAASHVWLTPREVLEPLGSFGLDPCAAPIPRPWPTAAEMWSPPIDGLSYPWHGRVWLNPPFGSHTTHWLAKLARHNFGTALVFARTDTRMFAEHVWGKASAVKFLTGRPHFHHPDGTRAKGNSGGPIMLIAYGEMDAEALRLHPMKGGFFK